MGVDELLEPWAWDEQTWREHIARAAPGPRLPAVPWPGTCTAAFALSFDCDHETTALRNGHTSPGALAQGTYGARVGIPRILNVLSREAATATFFTPAVMALTYADQTRELVSRGHEVALHGWIHERTTLLPPSVERDLAYRSVEVLERVTGTRPSGMRTPSWDFSGNTVQIASDLGLMYDSSLMADDEPYELLLDGEVVGIAELPVDWIRDDAAYLVMDRFDSIRPYTSPEAVLGIWLEELVEAAKTRGVFQLTLHPHIIGHRSRIWIIEELIRMAKERGMWIATHLEIIQHLRGVMSS